MVCTLGLCFFNAPSVHHAVFLLMIATASTSPGEIVEAKGITVDRVRSGVAVDGKFTLREAVGSANGYALPESAVRQPLRVRNVVELDVPSAAHSKEPEDAPLFPGVVPIERPGIRRDPEAVGRTALADWGQFDSGARFLWSQR